MKLNNKKGFTLIELLAVIVILAILLAIAIPSVSKYISNAKKSTFIVNVGDAILITFASLKNTLENGGKTSSYGAEFEEDYSYVLVVNEGSAERPRYGYYVAALDEKGYGIGVDKATKVIKADDLKEANIIQAGKGNGKGYSAAVDNLVGLPSGVTVNALDLVNSVYTSSSN